VKAFLLHSQKDFELERQLPPNVKALVQDLGLQILFDAMAAGDEFLLGVASTVVLSGLKDPAEIIYRQHVLEDCTAHPSLIKEIYDIAIAAIDGERKNWRSIFGAPDTVLSSSVEVLQLFVGLLQQLRRVADEHAAEFRSEGFTAFFETLCTELDDAYFRTLDDHLGLLRFRQGVPISARLGKRNTGTDFVLRKPRPIKWSWRQWIPSKERSAYTIVIAPRDEAGMQVLTELRGRGINLVANALAQSTDHILSFFRMVRFELGFYLGCLNLRSQLTAKGEPVCFPVPTPRAASVFSSRGLYDVGLSLRVRDRVVGNDVDAEGRSLVVITGANQGGKSTFLRSVGVAQLMMQSGMFVGAENFRADVRDAVFTHFKREEDPTMTSGKLDEELKRMSEIVDQLTPNSVVLFNESFAATNEREGAEIAQAIVHALLGAATKVFLVTHSFELAHRLCSQRMGTALFLRAERRPDGGRTFRQVEGEPLPTSYGEDLYERIFGEAPDVTPASVPT
jgi:DNA mismatch repair ATPase MutS